MISTNKAYHFKTVDDFNQHFGVNRLHPFMSVVDLKDYNKETLEGMYHYSLYGIFLMQDTFCTIRYGQHAYRYEAGSVLALSPGQTIEVFPNPSSLGEKCIGVVFHPDLIRNSPLSETICKYPFLNYDSTAAIQLTAREQDLFKRILGQMIEELRSVIDAHTQSVITSYLTLLMDYCQRYYDRQYYSHMADSSSTLAKFEYYLNRYYADGEVQEHGLPTVQYFAEKMGLNTVYFGKLVRRAAGVTAQQLIRDKIIEMAKSYIMRGTTSVAQVSELLGFHYPQHFTRVFHRIVGKTPSQFRDELFKEHPINLPPSRPKKL